MPLSVSKDMIVVAIDDHDHACMSTLSHINRQCMINFVSTPCTL